MPQNYFITGEPKTGKTTLLKDLIAELKKSGLKVGGFVSPEERHHGTRTAFHVMDIESGKKEVLASVDGDGPKVSKYHVNIRAFESIAIPAMARIGKYDVFVMDEIGRMEMKSARFDRMLDQVFESETPVIATLHSDYVEKYGLSGEVLALTALNRNQTYYTLLRSAKGTLKRKPAKAMPSKPQGKPARKKVVRTKPEEKKKVKKAMAKRIRESAKNESKKAPRPSAKKAPQRAAKKERPKRKGIVHHIKDLIGF